MRRGQGKGRVRLAIRLVERGTNAEAGGLNEIVVPPTCLASLPAARTARGRGKASRAKHSSSSFSLRPQNKGQELRNNFISGAIGGFVGTALNTPADVVKSRIREYRCLCWRLIAVAFARGWIAHEGCLPCDDSGLTLPFLLCLCSRGQKTRRTCRAWCASTSEYALPAAPPAQHC